MNTGGPDSPPPPSATLAPAQFGPRLRTRFIADRRRQAWLVLALCAAVAAASAWMYVGVEQSLRALRAQGLPALLEAKTKSLEVFIAERRADGERWARDSQIAGSTASLARHAHGRDIATHCRSAEAAEWRAQFATLIRDENVAAVNAVDRDGRIIGSSLPEICGLQAQPRIMAPQLKQVLAGRTQFIRPFAADSGLVAALPFLGTRPLAWVETPIRDDSGNVVAALGIATYVDRDFESILTAARPGETGEAYAFDETGTLLSEIRDVRGLHRSGMLPDGTQRTAFTLKVRDPGHELDGTMELPPAPPAIGRSRSRCRPRSLPRPRRRAGAPLQGVLLDPYRNYRGAEVIGAWRWLPDERMGIVAEIGLDEAYAPLRYVRATLAAILTLLVAHRGMGRMVHARARALAARPAAGRRIGAYRLEGELAEGGMATIHLAHHALLKRPTAIKILKRHLATDELAARFEREVRLVSELSHPNTIEIYDYGQTPDGLLYYAMEFVDGIALDALVAEDGALPLGRMRHIVLQICDVAGRSPRQGHGPSRHQAAERDDLRARRRLRLREGPRLRHREAHRGRVGRVSRRQSRADAPGAAARHAGLHGAGARRLSVGGGPAGRRVRRRCARLLPRVGARAVRRRERGRHPARRALRTRAAASRRRARRSRGARRARRALPLEERPWIVRPRSARSRRFSNRSNCPRGRRRTRVDGGSAGARATPTGRSLRRDVGIELALEPRDLVLEQELAPLHPAHRKFVGRRIALHARDGDVEVAMLELELDEALLKRHAVGVADAAAEIVVAVHQSVPTAAASSTSARRRW